MTATVSFLFALMTAAAPPPPSPSQPPLLLQTPSVSRGGIVFAFADDLWIAPRDGGEAHVLVQVVDRASDPVFSPDGGRVAYSARVNGNVDVYVVAVSGGEPKRLTWHPGDDRVVGWTPDGQRILFMSRRASANKSGRPSQLYTVPFEGGQQIMLPFERADYGSYSPDAASIAYTRYSQSQPDWRGYRGGQTSPIWIAKLSDSSAVPITHDNSTDRNPMWIGDRVYFLSDRDGPSTLYAYDTKTAKVERLVENKGFPIDSASAGDGAIVYSQMGALFLFDPVNRTNHPIDVRVETDGRRLAPRFVDVGKHIQSAALS